MPKKFRDELCHQQIRTTNRVKLYDLMMCALKGYGYEAPSTLKDWRDGLFDLPGRLIQENYQICWKNDHSSYVVLKFYKAKKFWIGIINVGQEAREMCWEVQQVFTPKIVKRVKTLMNALKKSHPYQDTFKSFIGADIEVDYFKGRGATLKIRNTKTRTYILAIRTNHKEDPGVFTNNMLTTEDFIKTLEPVEEDV